MLDVLLRKHKFAGAFLDTNLLVMYLIGSYKPSFVPEFKRTSMYSVQDFHWLNDYVSQFARVVVTPQVLAEAWNFLEKIGEKEFQAFLASAIKILHIMHEDYNHKDELFSADGFRYIGVTDISVIYAAKKLGCLVLTDDLRAYNHFATHNVTTININHLRQI